MFSSLTFKCKQWQLSWRQHHIQWQHQQQLLVSSAAKFERLIWILLRTLVETKPKANGVGNKYVQPSSVFLKLTLRWPLKVTSWPLRQDQTTPLQVDFNPFFVADQFPACVVKHTVTEAQWFSMILHMCFIRAMYSKWMVLRWTRYLTHLMFSLKNRQPAMMPMQSQTVIHDRQLVVMLPRWPMLCRVVISGDWRLVGFLLPVLIRCSRLPPNRIIAHYHKAKRGSTSRQVPLWMHGQQWSMLWMPGTHWKWINFHVPLLVGMYNQWLNQSS